MPEQGGGEQLGAPVPMSVVGGTRGGGGGRVGGGGGGGGGWGFAGPYRIRVPSSVSA